MRHLFWRVYLTLAKLLHCVHTAHAEAGILTQEYLQPADDGDPDPPAPPPHWHRRCKAC